ncbi:uncharacterized protein LOC129314340 [Prosopis cineraria]|uniref:uncharacterized protein LOC129314340 n=1 Tax=Prosopis cineraria TaxID=364024 RepID=UPI00240FD65E|nr:uncharacterized protein LOC129314340 [Prosopis cineraria]
MEIEKRRSRGSFLSLFDCNGVSRKKLFLDTPNLPDELKQAKENMGNMTESQLTTTKADESGINPSNITSCDFNCELSVSSDIGCESKVPCLVARLMGLDSLPTSTLNKLSLTSSRASNSPVSSHCHEDAVDPMKSRAHLAENRTIEARRLKNATMRVLDSKQKSEAAHHASMHENNVDANTFEGSRYSEKFGPYSHGSTGKSTLLAIQAKVRVQCRGALTSHGNRGHKQKEQIEAASNQFFGTQKPIWRQVMKQRACTSQNSCYDELGQGVQMHSSVTNKVRSTSIVESNKSTIRSSTSGAKKVTNKNFVTDKVRPNSSGRRASGAKKEFSLIKTNSNSMRNRYPKRDALPVNVVNSYEGKSIKCNITNDGSMNQDALKRNTGEDVISFTFTSPTKKASQSSTHTNSIDVNAPGLHMTDGDASSDLFNGKARDLASRTNSQECTLATRVPSAVSLSSEVSIESGEGDRRSHSNPPSGELQGMHNHGCSSSDDHMLDMNQAGEQAYGLSNLEDYNRPRNLKLEYEKDMLGNEKLMEGNFADNQTIRNDQVIKTNVFDMLEKWSSGTESDGEEHLKVERNLLFDFVSEFMELRRSMRQAFSGRYKGRALESQVWWEEDLCSEIKRFKSMREAMVDELVNMDMSSPHGTWLHFQTEPFQQILLSEIEWDISTSLINDLLLDLLHH